MLVIKPEEFNPFINSVFKFLGMKILAIFQLSYRIIREFYIVISLFVENIQNLYQ